MVEPEPIIVCVDCGGTCFLLTPPREDGAWLPGDVVTCCNDFGQLLVNGVPLEETYTELGGATKATAKDFTVTVPEGKLWVMGDNRYNSADSAYHYTGDPENPGTAFVPISNVVGRAVLVTWPLNRWSLLDNYPLVYRGVDKAGE